MPVDTKHPEYCRMQDRWKIMRDVSAGQKAVHLATCAAVGPHPTTSALAGVATVKRQLQSWPGEAYLPRLHDESWPNYCARKHRAAFFNATYRTIAGLVGMMFRKPPVFKVSGAAETMLEDVTKSGMDMDTFAMKLAGECVEVGRAGVFVDHPPAPAEGLTVAQVEALNLRPQMTLYRTEDIWNWDTRWINNRTMLSLVVLHEFAQVAGEDEFTPKIEERWRVLDLVDAKSEDGALLGAVYRVRLFRKKEVKKGNKKILEDEMIEDESYPQMSGALMREIPFQFFNVDDTSPEVSEPPLIDLAYTNISHYQSTADLEHGAHKTSLPQPWIAGIDAKVDDRGQPIELAFYMGGGDAWAFPKADTTVGMLEYTGAGLESLEKRLERKEAQMAVLGARMLEQQKAGVEAAETAGIHRSGEQATLASQARTISNGLTRVLGWFDAWVSGGGAEVSAEINRDFFDQFLDAQKLTALVGAWQQGAISKQTLFDNLKKGEVVSDAADFEIEETRIANQPPASIAPPAPAPTPAPAPAPA